MAFWTLFLFFCLSLATFPDWAIEKYSSFEEFGSLRSQQIESLRDELDNHLDRLYNNPSVASGERRELFSKVFLLTNAILEKTHTIPEPIIDFHYLDNGTVHELTLEILEEVSNLYHDDESKVENGVIYLMTGKGTRSVTGVGYNKTIVKNAILRLGIQVAFPDNKGILAAVFSPSTPGSLLPRANHSVGNGVWSPNSNQSTRPFFQNPSLDTRRHLFSDLKTRSKHRSENYPSDLEPSTVKEQSRAELNFLSEEEWRAFEAEFNEEPYRKEEEWVTVGKSRGSRRKKSNVLRHH